MKHLFLVSGAMLMMASTLSAADNMKAPCRMAQTNEQTMIISTDAQLPTVLAYLDNPIEDLSAMPEAFQSFIATYRNASALADNGQAPFMSLSTTASTTEVGPLLGNIKYNQGYPYNEQCPRLNEKDRSITGCVATAMAQIMRYYQHPACGVGSVQYTTSKGQTTFTFANHPFDWVNMLESYEHNSSSWTSAQIDAVANLMLACGASVNMNYSSSGSGTQAEYAQPAFKNYFQYPKAKVAVCTAALAADDAEDWAYTMMDQFDKGYPILWAGVPVSDAGHAFVIDGYKIENDQTYFHVNWGWGGTGDGYFLFSNMTTDPKIPSYTSYMTRMIYDIYPEGWTDIEEVLPTDGCQKMVENGQVVIIKDGVRYNVLGVAL